MKKANEQPTKKIVWDREAQERFKEKLRLGKKLMNLEVEEEWRVMKGDIKNALKTMQEEQRDRKRKIG